MMHKSAPAILLFFMLFCCACDKAMRDTEDNGNIQGYADSQVVGSWKITAISSDKPNDWDGNGTKETNIYATWSDCSKDNLYTFVGNKTGTYKTDCSNTNEGEWYITDDRKSIIYTAIGGFPEQDLITSLTSNQFNTRKTIFIANGTSFVISKTWSRQ